MTSDNERPAPRRRATIREQWAAHGTYPSPEREARRAGMVAGGLLVAIALVFALRIVGHVLLALWHWSAWS